MKHITFKRKSNYSNSWKSVAFLSFLMAVIAFTGYGYQGWDNTKVLAQELPLVREENARLTVEVKVATASSKPVWLSEDQIKNLLTILMPKQSDRTHFLAILRCENGNHDPKRVNVNAPGLGYDLGIAQVNSRFHANRVKEFFGEDFNDAMGDPVKNLVYATYLYQNSGNFHLWTCDRIVSAK